MQNTSRGWYIMSFDFFVTASFFSILGYGLCYITMANNKETINKK